MMALTGFVTTLNNSVSKTSEIPLGGAISCASVFNVKVVGKMKLTITAMNPAKNVLMTYKTMTFLTVVAFPLIWAAIALMTNTNTKIGATAFNAPTNKSPNIAIPLNVSGNNNANMSPITIPKIILVTKLI